MVRMQTRTVAYVPCVKYSFLRGVDETVPALLTHSLLKHYLTITCQRSLLSFLVFPHGLWRLTMWLLHELVLLKGKSQLINRTAASGWSTLPK